MSGSRSLTDRGRQTRTESQKGDGFYTEHSDSDSDMSVQPEPEPGSKETEIKHEASDDENFIDESKKLDFAGSHNMQSSDDSVSSLLSKPMDEIQAEMAQMQIEARSLEEQEEKMEQIKQLLELKARNNLVKKNIKKCTEEVRNLSKNEGQPSITAGSGQREVRKKTDYVNCGTNKLGGPMPSSGAEKPLTVTDLRNIQSLRDGVQDHIRLLTEGSHNRSVSPPESEVSDLDAASERDRHRGRISTGCRLKSGINAKACDEVVNPQIWPQTLLDFEYIANPIEYKDLDFGLFVAGELEAILSSNVPDKDKFHRLELLKNIVYYQRVYDWKSVLKMYSAIIRKIECGKAEWGEDFYRIERHTLVHKSKSLYSKSEVSGKRDRKVWFCRDYQVGKCEMSTPHKKYIGANEYTVHHICASCLQIDKVQLGHPESSAACPHNKTK